MATKEFELKIIIGSTRPNRFSDKAASWFAEIAKRDENFNIEVLDLRDYPMPFFEEPTSPSHMKLGDYKNEVVKKWWRKIEEGDAFVIVSPEYNHGYSAVLKNALDYVFAPWNNKPVAFVGYGSVGGGRAIEQLREVAVELQMAPIRNAVHILAPWFLLEADGSLKKGALDSYNGAAEGVLKQLSWWAETLRVGRGRPTK